MKTVEAQETGPLLMKQQLGYTLAGGVTGVGIGALLWFMDPLNPNVKPIDQAKDGFVYGSAFGALFGSDMGHHNYGTFRVPWTLATN